LQAGAQDPWSAKYPGECRLQLTRRNLPTQGDWRSRVSLDLDHEFQLRELHLTYAFLLGTDAEDRIWERNVPYNNKFSRRLKKWASFGELHRLDSGHFCTDSDTADSLSESDLQAEPSLIYRKRLGVEYLNFLAGECQHVDIPLESIIKIALVKEKLGRGVCILELKSPPNLNSSKPNYPGKLRQWLAACQSSPRHYIFGYFDELYQMLRRICYICPDFEGILYRGHMEEYRNLVYSVTFPSTQMNASDVNCVLNLCKQHTMDEFAEKFTILELWELAEKLKIRYLISAEADSFTIVENIYIYVQSWTQGPCDSESDLTTPNNESEQQENMHDRLLPASQTTRNCEAHSTAFSEDQHVRKRRENSKDDLNSYKLDPAMLKMFAELDELKQKPGTYYLQDRWTWTTVFFTLAMLWTFVKCL
jgi:hypothetical protein